MRQKILLVMIVTGMGVAADNPALEYPSKFFRLENGLRVFLMEKPTLPMVNCVVAFDVGSKNETDETSGMVHILEHYILFRGSQNRSGEQISHDIRSHGGYFNAHTGRDLSSFEMILPREHLEFGLRTHREILFFPDFRQDKLDQEKEVILEEFNQLQDDPVRLATATVYQNLFVDHPYRRPIYGNKETIAGATIEQLRSFYEAFFVPENAALALVGDFSVAQAEALIREIFGDLPAGDFEPPVFRKIEPEEKKIEIEHEMDVKLSYLAIGIPGPDYNHLDQFKIDVLVEILGRGINPMLHHPMIEKRISLNSLQMGYSAHKYGGAVLILLSVEPKNLKRAKNEIVRYLKRTQRLNFSSDDVFGEAQIYAMDYLKSAKNRIKFNGQLAEEKGLAIASSFVRYMLMNELPERGKYLDKIDEVKSQDLRKAADEWLSRRGYVTVMIKPIKKK